MAALRVLVVAEGPSEIGDLDELAVPVRGRRRREGYIPTMLRKLFPGHLEIEAQRVTKIGRYESKPRLAGEGDRAAQAVLVAEAKECAVLVFVRDVDKEHGARRSSVERRRKLRAMHEQVEAGFKATGSTVIAVKATPCRMIEAWALGDRKALERLGVKLERLGDVPHEVEEAWGQERDPSSNHPKCLLRRVLERDPTAIDFEDIARETDPSTLAKRCPDSFAPFLDEVRKVDQRMVATARVRGRGRKR